MHPVQKTTRIAVLTGCLISSSLALADGSSAQATLRQSTNIPAQPLDSALQTLAKQRGLQIIYLSGIVNSVRTQGAIGVLTRDEALTQLLKGTGLLARHVDEETVTILLAPAATADALGKRSAQSDMPLGSQAPEKAPAGPAKREQPIQLQEVMVTARKREEKLLDVPAPVSAITADTLELTRATHLEDYLLAMPGVSFAEGRGGEAAVIFRGLTTGGGTATALTYLDNIPLTLPAPHAPTAFVTPSLDSVDLLQVEADRGPQGTLYGANAVGGVLKYITVKPDLSNFSVRTEVAGEMARGGGLGGVVRGAVNVPLVSDTLALRLSAFTRKDPGYVDDPTFDLHHVDSTHTYGFRGAVLWKPSDAITVNLSSLLQVVHDEGAAEVDIDPNTRRPLYGDFVHKSLLRDEFFVGRHALYTTELQWDLRWAKLLTSTGFYQQTNGRDIDISAGYSPMIERVLGVSIPNFGIDNPLQLYGRQITEELRLTSATHGPAQWQVGAYYAHDLAHFVQAIHAFDTATQELITDLGPIAEGYIDDNYVERSGFGNLDYHFTRHFDVNVGARYSMDDQASHAFFEGAFFGPEANLSGPVHEHAFTWSVTTRFRPNDLQTLYIRVATGYRLGGAAFLIPQGPAVDLKEPFKPERLINYEVGWKASLPDLRAVIDLSVYYIRWQDIQETIHLASFNYGANGGTAFSEGMEAAFGWTPVSGLNFSANLTYNDNRLEDDRKPPYLSQSGKRLPYTPRFSGQFNADYKFPVTVGTVGFVGMTVYATAARPNGFSLGFDPSMPGLQGPLDNYGVVTLYNPNTLAVTGYTENSIPPYVTLDLRAGITHGAWTMEAYVKNVTDTRAWNGYGGVDDPNYPNFSRRWRAFVLPPRIAGVSVSMKF